MFSSICQSGYSHFYGCKPVQAKGARATYNMLILQCTAQGGNKYSCNWTRKCKNDFSWQKFNIISQFVNFIYLCILLRYHILHIFRTVLCTNSQLLKTSCSRVLLSSVVMIFQGTRYYTVHIENTVSWRDVLLNQNKERYDRTFCGIEIE